MKSSKKGDRIKGLKLQGFGRLNFTYYSKLQRPHYSSAAAEVDDLVYFGTLIYCGTPRLLQLQLQGSKVDEGAPKQMPHQTRCHSRQDCLQSTRLLQRLVQYVPKCRSLSPFIWSPKKVSIAWSFDFKQNKTSPRGLKTVKKLALNRLQHSLLQGISSTASFLPIANNVKFLNLQLPANLAV